MFSPNDRLRRAMPWLLAAGLAVLPFGLMRPLLGTPWVQTFALTFAFAALPVAGALGLAAGPRTGGRPWRAALLGGSLVAVMVGGRGLCARHHARRIAGRGFTGAPASSRALQPGFSLAARVVMLAAVSLGIFLLAAAGLRLGRPGRVTVDTVVAGCGWRRRRGWASPSGLFHRPARTTRSSPIPSRACGCFCGRSPAKRRPP